MRPEDIVWNQAIAAAIVAYKDGIGALYDLIRRPEQVIDGEIADEG